MNTQAQERSKAKVKTKDTEDLGQVLGELIQGFGKTIVGLTQGLALGQTVQQGQPAGQQEQQPRERAREPAVQPRGKTEEKKLADEIRNIRETTDRLAEYLKESAKSDTEVQAGQQTGGQQAQEEYHTGEQPHGHATYKSTGEGREISGQPESIGRMVAWQTMWSVENLVGYYIDSSYIFKEDVIKTAKIMSADGLKEDIIKTAKIMSSDGLKEDIIKTAESMSPFGFKEGVIKTAESMSPFGFKEGVINTERRMSIWV